MSTAPKDGTEIVIKVVGNGMRRVRYIDCQWLRDRFEVQGQVMDGDPACQDCWRSSDDTEDFELAEAAGWRPAR